MAMARGTSRDRYIRVASSSVFTPIAMPGPARNVQSCTATSARLTVTSAPGSAPGVPARSWRSVTTDSRLMIPVMITMASTVRPAM